jgi:hypothetical protein
MSLDGDESMSDVSEHMLLRDLLDTSCHDKENEMQLSFTDEIGVIGTPNKEIPKELFAVMDQCLKTEEMYPSLLVKECKRFNASPSIID